MSVHQKEVYLQKGGTCYAYAVTEAIHSTMVRNNLT
mgnify:CR=1 FL=1